MKKRTVKIPNQLISDARLTPATRKIGVYLYAHRNRFGCCHKSLAELADLTGYNKSTVLAATKALATTGYLTIRQKYSFSAELLRPVYGKKMYTVNLSILRRGYTFIPRYLLSKNVPERNLTSAAFLTMLYLYICAGNNTRAWPSLSKIHCALNIAKSTVCLALQQIKHLPSLLVRKCKTQKGSFAANSYIICNVVDPYRPKTVAPQSSATKKPKHRPLLRVAHMISNVKKRLISIFNFVEVVRFTVNLVKT